jgi:hypothetical protein
LVRSKIADLILTLLEDEVKRILRGCSDLDVSFPFDGTTNVDAVVMNVVVKFDTANRKITQRL